MPSLPFLFIAALWASALNPITLSVYPAVGMPPMTVRARTIVERHPDNRILCLAYEGPEDKKSCFALEGEKDSRVFTKFWFLRVSGEYHALADLTRIEGGRERHYLARQDFTVIGFP